MSTDSPTNENADPSANFPATSGNLLDRLQHIERVVEEIHGMLQDETPRREWFTTREAAKLIGRAEYTVREWCRLNRVNAHKRPCGRGTSQEWILSRDEIERIRDKGLLPRRP